ncbi:Immunity protein 35 domain-containing protein [Nocardia ninae]
MPEQYRTRGQVEQYLAHIFNPNREYRLNPFEKGWVCSPILTSEEIAAGQGLGSTRLVIDSETGVVIEYPSWSDQMVMDDYNEAKRTGRAPMGGQVYPPRWQVTFDRIREDPTEVEYLVHVSSPTEPATQQRLIINKQTLRSRTSTSPIHPASAQAKAWAHANREPDGTWPPRGTFSF